MNGALSRTLRSFALMGALVLAGSCGGSDSPTDIDDGGNNPPPVTVASVTAVTTPGQQPVGASVTVEFRVTGSDGQPFAGTSVAFSANAGTVSPASATTGSTGTASTSWTLGTTVGTQTLTATAGGRSATVSVTTQAGAPAAFAKVSGDNQAGPVGQALANPVVVSVKDAFGNPLAGQSVAFAVTAGGGSVGAATATTQADGNASVSWTMGSAPGTNTLTATHALGTVTFNATGQVGAPAAISKVAGDNQSATVGTAVATAPRVKVVDAQGNGVSGVSVTFAVASGGGSITGATATTASDGTAAVGSWTLGATPGANTLTASATGLASVTFTATGTAAAPVPTAITKVAGDNQSATVGTAVATAPRVKVVDAQGNGVSGVAVTFAVASGGGSVTGGSATTGSDGTAAVGSWTLGATPGANTLTASATGLTAVTFTATGTAAQTAGYTITLRYIGSMSSGVQAAFEAAKARWEQIITGDLPNSTVNSTAGECSDNQPAVNETVDDILIFAEVAAIDGVGGTLGQAGPCYIRTSSGLALMGTMTFDEADLASMETGGTLTDVIIHEMGHVLGIGTLWENRSLLQGKGTDDPFFSGANGIAGYQTLGGVVTNGVPVENTGEEGTRDGHWRESVFQTELMTGYISAPGNPISILTVRSLVDHGYTVNDAAADSYSIPSPASPVAAAVEQAKAKWERLLKPKVAVTPEGTKLPIR